MTKAERQREYRKRLRSGLAPYRIDIGDDVFSTLLYRGWLNDETAQQPEAVRAALSRMAREWARTTNPFLVK